MNYPTTIKEFDKVLRPRKLLDRVAEVGVAEGRTSRMFLEWGVEHLYLIDLWKTTGIAGSDVSNPQEWHDKNFSDVIKLTKEYPKKVIILQGFTIDQAKRIPDGSLGFCYIDANHSYDGVMADLNAYFPKLRPGGIMAGHDFLNPNYGVKDAVQRFCYGKLNVHTLPENEPNNANFFFIKPST